MKTKKVKLLIRFLLLFQLCGGVLGAGCEKNEDGYSDFVDGYIIGTFICDKVDAKTGEASADKTRRGYCILMESSEITNSPYPMDFYTFDLSSDLFDFPNEILSPNFDSSNCGPNFFPDDLRNMYKIKFKYQILDKDDEFKFVCGPCMAMELAFPWEDYNQIKLRDIIINN